MIKHYNVTVNGTVYEVELEELTGSAPVSAPAAPAAAPAPVASAGNRLPVSRSAPPCPATFWPSTSPPGRP